MTTRRIDPSGVVPSLGAPGHALDCWCDECQGATDRAIGSAVVAARDRREKLGAAYPELEPGELHALEVIESSLALAVQWLERAAAITPRPENAETISMLFMYAASEVGSAQADVWRLPPRLPIDREAREAIHLVRFFVELALTGALEATAASAVEASAKLAAAASSNRRRRRRDG